MNFFQKIFSSLFELKDNLTSYTEEFRSKFENYERDIQSALNKGKSTYKLLLIFHHSPQSPVSKKALHSLLRNEELISVINQHYIIYFSNVNTPNGKKLEDMHEIYSFPTVSVVFPFNGITKGLLTTITHSDLTSDTLTKVALQNFNMLQNIRERHEEETQRRMMREQQEREYQQALAEAQRREEEERKKREEEKKKREEEERKIREEKERQQKLLDEKEAMKRDMEQKAALFAAEEEPTGKETALIAIRFPNGKKIQRRFKITDTIQKIYDYTDANQYATRKYQLVRSLPKTILNDKSKTLQEEKLVMSATLVVVLNVDQ